MSLYSRRCTCGNYFKTAKKDELHCPHCRMYYARCRLQVKLRQKELSDFLTEINDYNEKHGTRLSYGQYVAMQYTSIKRRR